MLYHAAIHGICGELGNMNKKLLKSIGAVVAGAAVSIVLELGTDKAMRTAGIFPSGEGSMSDTLFILATTYRTIYGVLGAYITARLAPDRPMFHALILGVLGTVAAAAGAIAMWNKMPEIGPKWYALALIVLALPPAWLGGKLRLMQVNDQTESSLQPDPR
jgi:hypothetical protein